MKLNPTTEFYECLNLIYTFYNKELFNDELPNTMFIISRKNNSFGYYSPERWINNEKVKSDEIGINPMMFGKYPMIEILKTIAHEMCHLWQHHFGNKCKMTYHNKEWGDKMESIGLMPSNTGVFGGSKTGQQMMEYIIDKGLFDLKSDKLIQDQVFQKLWFDILAPVTYVEENIETNISLSYPITTESNVQNNIRDNSNSKIKYSCPSCKSNVWGKKELQISCDLCNESFVANLPG
jgi:predicted SprT family Zn-dependent metalloprotease